MADAVSFVSRHDARSREARTAIYILSIFGIFTVLIGLILIAVTLLNVNWFLLHVVDFIWIILGFFAAQTLTGLFLLILAQALAIFAIMWDAILAILRLTAAFNCIADSSQCPAAPDSQYTLLLAGSIAAVFFFLALFFYVNLRTIIRVEKEYKASIKHNTM